MNLFELFVKIGVDDQASGPISKITSGLGKGLATAAKIGTAAVGAAAAGITALTRAAVDNYAEYEQLVGGIETLFEDLSWDVGQNAAKAFQTAGLSANEYMSTAMSFAASLNQSLVEMDGNIARSADLTDQAILDMADNANKMGSDMSTLQTAYAGFAKQNYTLLDNLKIGYGGTKEEMQRLIADAAELSDTVDAQSMSFANIVEAIHVVQTEMGITGTTSKEAGTTIQGSVASMQSAWTNLLTGLANGNADIEQLVGNLVTTIVGDGTETNLGVLGNILPAVETALNGASTLVGEALPKIMEIIPEIINENLPILVEAAVGIIQSLIDGISQNKEMLFDTILGVVTYLAESFVTMLPQIVELGLDLIDSLANGIAENLPELIPTIVDVILQIVDTLTDPNTLSNLIDAAIAITIALADGLIDSLPELLEKAPEIVQNLVDAIIDNAPKLLESALTLVLKLVEGILSNLPELVTSGIDMVSAIIEGIVESLGDLIMKGKDIVDSVKEGFSAKVEEAKTWGKDMIQNFIDGISEKWDSLKEKASGVAQTVKDYLGFSEPKKGPLSNFHTYAPDMMELFAKGIRDNERVVTDQIERSFNFGTRTIDFSSSGVGASSAGIINSMQPSKNTSNPITVNLMLPDNTVLARYQLPALINVANANGTPIVNPT